MEPSRQTATLAGGCFWCTEAIFKRLKGVTDVVSGYAGGGAPNPSYATVARGVTNHAEAIQMHFDQSLLPYAKLLEIFFHLHNPTTKNQQGADVGSEYRSIIFYHSEEQRRVAEAAKAKIIKEKVYGDNLLVTEIVPYTTFYKAEDYHQNYYDKAPGSPYCRIVIDPKIDKLLAHYRNDVKEEYKA